MLNQNLRFALSNSKPLSLIVSAARSLYSSDERAVSYSLEAAFGRVTIAGEIAFVVHVRKPEELKKSLPWLAAYTDDVLENGLLAIGKPTAISGIIHQGRQIGTVWCMPYSNAYISNKETRSVARKMALEFIPEIRRSQPELRYVGLGGMMPSITGNGMLLEMPEDITVVTGHHTTSIAARKLGSGRVGGSTIAIIGAGAMSRGYLRALLLEKELPKKILVFESRWDATIPDEILVLGLQKDVHIEMVYGDAPYDGIEQATVILTFISSTDYPLDRHIQAGGKFHENVKIIDDSQPWAISWKGAKQLRSQGGLASLVLTHVDGLVTPFVFQRSVGGYAGDFSYTCLAEVFTAWKNNLESDLVGEVSLEKLQKVSKMLENSAVTFPDYPIG